MFFLLCLPVHAPARDTLRLGTGTRMRRRSLFCLSFRIRSSAVFQLACVFQLILLPDVLYFVLAKAKRVYGLNYSSDGSWMKGTDSCSQWQDICMRSPFTLVADALDRGQTGFGIATASAFTVVAETYKKHELLLKLETHWEFVFITSTTVIFYFLSFNTTFPVYFPEYISVI